MALTCAAGSRATGSPWSRNLPRHLLQLDDIALRISHIDRLASSTRAVAVSRLSHHLNSAGAQIDGGRVQVGRFHAETEVIYVEALLHPPGLGGNQIDHAPASPKLNQTELSDTPFLGESKNAGVEIKRPFQVATGENDMIKLGDFEGPIHRDTP